MNISKISNKFKIIRRSGFTKSKDQDSIQVEVSNKDSKLDNNIFNDLVLERKKQKKKNTTDQNQESDSSDGNSNDDTTNNSTDFYI